jgi:signal transduction histidine kinase
VPFLPDYFVNQKFIFPNEILKDKKLQQQLHSELNNAIRDESLNSFSIYLNTEKKALVITLSEIQSIKQNDQTFLIAINNDYLLTKAREINNAVFIINFIIILLVMLGLSYLIINRIHLMHEKDSFQQNEEKLKKINQSKDKFFSIVAHDLKNPFNGIMGLSGYLSTEYDSVDDKEKKEIINDINIASKNAYNLLQNLLEWTKAQSGLIKNIPVIIEPNKIIELALETVSNIAKYKDIHIKEYYQTKACGYADENLVSTVIRNLSTNAIKFSPRNSVVEITVSEYKDELVFCVKDQGIGISDKEIDQLFRIDVNFHKRGTEKESGSGLGLKLCKEFVEYCKGRIWVVSDVEVGSSFYFTIPRYKA